MVPLQLGNEIVDSLLLRKTPHTQIFKTSTMFTPNVSCTVVIVTECVSPSVLIVPQRKKQSYQEQPSGFTFSSLHVQHLSLVLHLTVTFHTIHSSQKKKNKNSRGNLRYVCQWSRSHNSYSCLWKQKFRWRPIPRSPLPKQRGKSERANLPFISKVNTSTNNSETLSALAT